jgi:hypothetical protein
VKIKINSGKVDSIANWLASNVGPPQRQSGGMYRGEGWSMWVSVTPDNQKIQWQAEIHDSYVDDATKTMFALLWS